MSVQFVSIFNRIVVTPKQFFAREDVKIMSNIITIYWINMYRSRDYLECMNIFAEYFSYMTSYNAVNEVI